MQSFDVVIVGGGIVGCTLACALASKSSLQIAVIDSKSASGWTNNDYHPRVSAITLASQRILRALNIWDVICNSRVSPFERIEVWDEAGNTIFFAANEIAEANLGFIIENNLIHEVLIKELKRFNNVSVMQETKIISLQQSNEHIQITIDENKFINTKLIIGADGANSWIRDQFLIPVKKYDYEQQGLVTHVHTVHPHNKTARQVFLKDGPLAFLPLADSYFSSIVWTLPNAQAEQLKNCDEQQFKNILNQQFSHLGNIEEITQRYSFPLYKQQASHYIKPQVALIGDAAHTIHPLAGQGVNLGLLDAACLAEVIINAYKQNRRFYSYDTLRGYERWRKTENALMLNGVDVISLLFDGKSFLQSFRKTGLAWTNKASIIKRQLIQHAVGNLSHLPELAR